MSKAAATRLTILHKAFELIYTKGYQATSVDDIIKQTRVTKGAFFYHFKNKDEMGLAMIQEVMYPRMYQAMVQPLAAAQDPVQEIYRMMKDLLVDNPYLLAKYGCPAINLIEEMSPLNETFREALSHLADQWQGAIAACLKNGKAAGQLRADVHVTTTACFIISGYGGIRNLGKIYGAGCYQDYLKALKQYLKSLQ